MIDHFSVCRQIVRLFSLLPLRPLCGCWARSTKGKLLGLVGLTECQSIALCCVDCDVTESRLRFVLSALSVNVIRADSVGLKLACLCTSCVHFGLADIPK